MVNKRAISKINAIVIIVLLAVVLMYIFSRVLINQEGTMVATVPYTTHQNEVTEVISEGGYPTSFSYYDMKIEDYFIEESWLNEKYYDKVCEILIEKQKEDILNQSDLLYVWIRNSRVVEELELAEFTSDKVICDYELIWDIEKIAEGTLKFDKLNYIAAREIINVDEFNYSKIEINWNPDYEEYRIDNYNNYYNARIKLKMVEK